MTEVWELLEIVQMVPIIEMEEVSMSYIPEMRSLIVMTLHFQMRML